MAKKKDQPPDAVVKVEPDLHRQLTMLAAHKGSSIKGLVEALLRDYVAKEWPKMLAEMQRKP